MNIFKKLRDYARLLEENEKLKADVEFWKRRSTSDFNVMCGVHNALDDERVRKQRILEALKKVVKSRNRYRRKYVTLHELRRAVAKKPLRRGVDFACENCSARLGSTKDNGWWRCSGCGYPGQ